MKNENYSNIDFNEIIKNKEKYAKVFSEGSKELEKTLLSLWNKGIETKGCCKGHDDKKSKQYIGISLDKNLDMVVHLLSSLDKNNLHISIVRLKDDYLVSIKKYNNEDIYDNIIKSIDGKALNKNIENTVNKTLKYKLDYYINIHYYYKNNKLKECHFITNDPNIINKSKNKYEIEAMGGDFNCIRSTEYIDLLD